MSDRSDDPEFVRWAKAVKVNNNFVCQICGASGVYLEAHHKNSWNAYPDQRYDLDNGITLCQHHHRSFHEQFGYGNNTEYQYQQYEEIANILRKLANQKSPPDFLSHPPESREEEK